MPSRKQRRRRQKERRHEYEYVWVDEEGHEVEVEPEDIEREAKTDGRTSPGRSGRPLAKVDPPSWRRVARRAVIFFPLFLIGFTLINTKQAWGTRLAIAVFYTLLFIPFLYWMDRIKYRTYVKRGGQPSRGVGARRR
jgi:hypothetical protein